MLKKGVLFIFILFSLSFISAGVCNSTIQGAHGVEIGGDCFDCSEISDGICPEDFGLEDCTADGGVEDYDCLGPEVPTYYWSSSGDTETQIDELAIDMVVGAKIKAVGKYTGLSESVDIDVYEYDYGILASDELLGTITGTITNGKLIGTYTIDENDEEDITGGEPEGDGYYTLYFKVNGERSNYLNVTFDYVGEGVGVCGDYDNETECNEDINEVANNTIITPEEREEGCFYDKWGECSWEGGGCLQLIYEEEADGNDEDCEDAIEGSCTYIEEGRIGSCDAGDDFFKVIYNSSQIGCPSWTSNSIPCLQQLRVPFFGFYGFIVSLLVIGLMYFLINKRFIK